MTFARLEQYRERLSLRHGDLVMKMMDRDLSPEEAEELHGIRDRLDDLDDLATRFDEEFRKLIP